ncbi:GerAB/ArcD/ProY family transporter [Schinkia sp. CFF1]
MNRYFFYLVLLNMLINVVVFVPEILLAERYKGAVMAILLATPIGMTLTIMFARLMSKFPQKDFPEIIGLLGIKWLQMFILVFFSLVWFSAGSITLNAFITISKRFINPSAPTYSLLFIFLVAIVFAIQLKSDRILYLLEILLIVNFPLIGFIIFKAMSSEYFVWDSILEVGTYFNEVPSWSAIGSASYIFSGYLNLIIFNKVFTEKIKKRWFVLILFFGFFNSLTSFFIPIGFHGADPVNEYVYPWVSTADSIRIEYGPIERVIFLFLTLYISLSLISVTVHWHVALKLMKGAFLSQKYESRITWSIIAFFVILSSLFVYYLPNKELHIISKYWMEARLIFEIVVIMILFLLARRKKS